MNTATIEKTKTILKKLPKSAENVKLLVAGKEVDLPPEIYQNILEILGELANGNAVKIVPERLEFTTQQAAKFLHVSRPFVIKLLEVEKVIPFRKVGSHRRIRFSDLLDYRGKDDIKRKQALEELQSLSQEMGFY